jgi:hypothetical protein
LGNFISALHACTLEVNFETLRLEFLKNLINPSQIIAADNLSNVTDLPFNFSNVQDLRALICKDYSLDILSYNVVKQLTVFNQFFFLQTLLNEKNQTNNILLNQLYLSTGADTSHIFYFNSLVNFEDFGLNFTPAIKELVNKSQAYAAYQYNVLLKSISNTKITSIDIFNNINNFGYTAGFELSNREYLKFICSRHSLQPNSNYSISASDDTAQNLKSAGTLNMLINNADFAIAAVSEN